MEANIKFYEKDLKSFKDSPYNTIQLVTTSRGEEAKIFFRFFGDVRIYRMNNGKYFGWIGTSEMPVIGELKIRQGMTIEERAECYMKLASYVIKKQADKL